jgi:dephospho-CoA kinase
MLTYGLTGGIASGKSTVCHMFSELGVAVFDADTIGRELLAENTDLSRAVRERCPDCVAGNNLDRKHLAERVFSDPGVRSFLEELLHPAILERFLSDQNHLPKPHPPFCILEGAALLESQTRFPLCGILVVTAPLSKRIQRLRSRDGLDDSQIRSRLQVQGEASRKVLQSTHWIDNGGSLIETEKQVRIVAGQLFHETCAAFSS